VNSVSGSELTALGWIVITLFATVLSFLSTVLALRLALHGGVLAQPGERQSHSIATPTGGGLGLIFSLVVTSLLVAQLIPLPIFWLQNVIPGLVILSLVGWLDDRRQVAALLRLLVQLTVSLWLLNSVCSWGSLSDMGVCSLMILAVVWLMNLYNFMDGSNGMAGFQGVFAGLAMAGLFIHAEQHSMALLAVILAAVCAGFLPLNFPRASVFMGDAASVPLGFIIAALAIQGIATHAMSLAIALIVMALFIVDASLTLSARVLRGERWYNAHNQHIYQRLIAQGWSHGQVLMAYQAMNVGLVLPAIVLAVMYPQNAVEIAGLVILALSVCWCLIKRRLAMSAKEQQK